VSQSDYPTTDAEEIKLGLKKLLDALDGLSQRLDGQAAGINHIGENLNWLVQNTQGLFQMFASPQFAAQMSNMLMGGMTSAGRPEDPGTPGADPGTSGS
jgi:hypothetical protein